MSQSPYFKQLQKQLGDWTVRFLFATLGLTMPLLLEAKLQTPNIQGDTIKVQPINQIQGILWDEETHEPVAYANVFYKGTALGVYTDFEGQFNLGYRPWPSDTIEIVYMGYETVTIALDTVKTLPLQIYFKRKIERTEGATIRLGINPAMIWVNLAQKNRNANSPDRIKSYECEVFSKTTVAINNISKNLKKTKLATEVGSYFDTISYLTGDSNKAILPVLFSEVLSDFSFQRNPKLTKELVKATRIRGIGVTDGTFIGQMMGNTFTNYNIYDESLVVLDKGIPTPISPGAEVIYDYKLVNVDKMGPRRLFQIQVTPKNPRDLALSGFIWIEDTSGAIVRLSVEITGASNLNYIEKLKFSQEYIPTETGAYFCTKARVMIDIGELSDQAAGMVATNVLSCKNIRFGMDFPPRFFDNRIQIAPEANLQNDSFWLKNAHIKQSAEEARISSKIDTLNSLPRVKSYIDLVNFLVDGYQRIGKIDIGPYFTLASWNPYEGFRMKLGFRTTPAISKNMQTSGFLAYGFRDQAYKYGLKTDIILNRTYLTKLTISHTYDTELIGLTDNEIYSQSLFTAFNLFGSNNITLVRQSKVNLGTDLRPGLRINVGAFHGVYDFPYVKNYRFAYHSNYPDTNSAGISNHITNAHVSFRLFYEPKSYDIRTDYDRMTFSAGGPKYSLYLQQGIKGLLGSQYNYTKVQLGYIYDQTWSIMGRSIFGVDYNQVFGLLPYPLLTVYVGNRVSCIARTPITK